MAFAKRKPLQARVAVVQGRSPGLRIRQPVSPSLDHRRGRSTSRRQGCAGEAQRCGGIRRLPTSGHSSPARERLRSGMSSTPRPVSARAGPCCHRATGNPPAVRASTRVEVILATGTYVVRCAIDPSTNETCAFPARRTQDIGRLISRGIEGKQFHAWSEWEKLAHPLIAKTRTTDQ